MWCGYALKSRYFVGTPTTSLGIVVLGSAVRHQLRHAYVMLGGVPRRMHQFRGGECFRSHDGILTGRQLREVQYQRWWGHLGLSVEGARPTHRKHQLYAHVFSMLTSEVYLGRIQKPRKKNEWTSDACYNFRSVHSSVSEAP